MRATVTSVNSIGSSPAELSIVKRHLGATERRPLGRAGEDDVVHLLAAHRTGGLGAQHPGDRVDHVGLARPVGSDHHRDPRLQLEGGRVGERLESFEGQRLQEHGARDHSRADLDALRTPPRPCPSVSVHPGRRQTLHSDLVECLGAPRQAPNTPQRPCWSRKRPDEARGSALAAGAEAGGAAAGDGPHDRGPAAGQAALAGTVVDPVIELEAAAVAHHVDVLGIGQACYHQPRWRSTGSSGSHRAGGGRRPASTCWPDRSGRSRARWRISSQ